MKQPLIIEHEDDEEPSVRLKGILYGSAIILWAALMGGWQYLMVGINEDFGAGLVIGFAICIGALSIISREARSL